MTNAHQSFRIVCSCYYLVSGGIPIIIGIAVPQVIQNMSPRITEVFTIDIHAKRWLAVGLHFNPANRCIISLFVCFFIQPVTRSRRSLELMNLPFGNRSVIVVNTIAIFQPTPKFLEVRRSIVIYVVSSINTIQIWSSIIWTVSAWICCISSIGETPTS